MNFSAEHNVKGSASSILTVFLWLSQLCYFLNGYLCISQATSSRLYFLWGSHFLTWIVSMWPVCPVHTDTPVQPVAASVLLILWHGWSPIFKSVSKSDSAMYWVGSTGHIVITHPACVTRSVICLWSSWYVAFLKLHLESISSFSVFSLPFIFNAICSCMSSLGVAFSMLIRRPMPG